MVKKVLVDLVDHLHGQGEELKLFTMHACVDCTHMNKQWLQALHSHSKMENNLSLPPQGELLQAPMLPNYCRLRYSPMQCEQKINVVCSFEIVSCSYNYWACKGQEVH